MSEPDPASRPRVRRVHLRVPVSLYDGRRSIPAEVRNLSEGGAFLAVDPPLTIETGLSFWLPVGGRKVLVRGHVRWTRSLAGEAGEPVGCGLEFYDPERTLPAELAPLLERPGRAA